MIITNGVGYVHIQKTAGTSIRQAMMMSGDTFYIGKINEPEEDIGSRANKFNAHFNPKELAPLLKNLFTFTCVRNPWDRMVSWYTYLNSDRTFEEFVQVIYEPKERAKGMGIQNSPIQSDYFDGIEYDLVIPFEGLNEQWVTIQRRLKLAVVLQTMNKSNHKAYHKYYTPDLVDIVADKEKYVIERFGYQFK